MNNILSEKIIEEIKRQGIKPRPRWQFLLKRWVLWSLAVFSAVLGSIAIAIIIFTFIDHDASVRVYLQGSAVADILLAIPYFWLITLAVLTGVAKYAVRHTQFGYRYATTRIITAVLIGSTVLGITLNVMDVTGSIQDFLIETVPAYDALIYTSKDAWSRPEKGALGGTVINIGNSDYFELLDFHKKTWRIDMSELQDHIDINIKPGMILKIIGTQKDNSTFRAGQIFPWNN